MSFRPTTDSSAWRETELWKTVCELLDSSSFKDGTSSHARHSDHIRTGRCPLATDSYLFPLVGLKCMSKE
jgi:hypothetical protein